MWLHIPRKYLSSASLPASADSTWASSLQLHELAASCAWKGKLMPLQSWRRAWKKNFWIAHLSGATLPQHIMGTGRVSFQASLPDFHVLRCQPPANEKVLMIRAGYGLKLSDVFASLGRNGVFWKTSPDSYLPTMEWLSEQFSGTWPKSGSMRSGACYRRPTVAPASGGNESLCWPGARASERGSYQRDHGAKDGKQRPTLTGAAELWPTPSASVAQDGETPTTWLDRREELKKKSYSGNGAGMPLTIAACLWATPNTARRGTEAPDKKLERQTKSGAGCSDLLTQAEYWATPTAKDVKGGFNGHSHGGQDLSHQVRSATTGQLLSPTTRILRPRLNPDFVAWLMGIPTWWTNFGLISSGPWAMQSYLSVQRSLLVSLLAALPEEGDV